MPSCNGIMPSDGFAKPKEEEGGTPLFDIDPSGLLEILSPLDTKRVRSSAERWGIIGDDLSSGFDKPDGVYYSERWKGTPRSGCFEPHPFVGEAWEAFRRSVLHLRGQPVEIVAALDNYSEEFNDDQVPNELEQNYFVGRGNFGSFGLPPALTSDSESWMVSAKKRKVDSATIPPATRIVTVKTTLNDDVVIFRFPISSGLLNLKDIVAQRFKLKSKRLSLKYIDKENDLILIACDEDLKFAVDTTAINNSINLICISDGVCAGCVHNVEVIQPTLEFVADNFSSDSESLVATGVADAGEKSHQGKKRKTESDTLPPVTGLVTSKVTYNKCMKVFQFFISSGIKNLENEVAQSFKLKGKKLRLKYWDEDDDLILIACDVDLKLAVVTTGINNTINLNLSVGLS